MRFRQLDRITELTAGSTIQAVRTLRADESYLADHFPNFPVMPGVLMLEALYQAGMWLVLATEDFRPSMVVLAAARNVKYTDFVVPGQTLTVRLDITKHGPQTTQLKAHGELTGPNQPPSRAVSARLELERFCLADRYPERAATDPLLRREMRQRFDLLLRPAESGGAV
jgi:3-hydroxyacyl-[acyl-carrier-protein] dehydratase